MTDAARDPSVSSRLIFVDGLPGSGKSTTAQRLCLHLRWLGRPARWYFEHELGHPLYDDEPVRAARATGSGESNEIFARARERASTLVRRLLSADETLLLESSLFQTAVGTQLLMDRPREEVAEHFRQIVAILAPAQPVLVLFRPPDVAAALRHALAVRGSWFGEFLVQHLGDTPRGRRTKLRTFDDVIAFFVEYREVCDGLAAQFPGPRLVLADAAADWARAMREITDFIGLPPVGIWPVPPAVATCPGRFRSATGDEWTVAADAQGLFLEGAGAPRLWPTPAGTWVLEGVCVEIEFNRDEAGRVRGLSCRGALPHLPVEWGKV
jgi:hypothetical protein